MSLMEIGNQESHAKGGCGKLSPVALQEKRWCEGGALGEWRTVHRSQGEASWHKCKQLEEERAGWAGGVLGEAVGRPH